MIIAKNENKYLYFFEGIASIMVVFIHITFPEKIGGIVGAVARFAISLFFMISGYFLYADSVTLSKIARKIKHIFSLILLTFVVYFPYQFIIGKNLNLGLYFKHIYNKVYFLKILIFNDWLHTWFLLALLYCYILTGVILYFFKDFVKRKTVLYVSAVLLGIHYISRLVIAYGNPLFNSQIIVFDYAFGSAELFRNWLFMGFPFFIMGYYFHAYSVVILGHIQKNVGYVFLAGGMLISIFEYMLYNMTLELYIGTVLMSFGAFIITFSEPNKCPNRCVSSIGKKYSTYVYLFHPIFISVVYKFSSILKVQDYLAFSYIKPFLVVVFSIIGAICFEKGKKMLSNGNSTLFRKISH